MTYASCPTAVVDAPVGVVWMLLTEPAGWGNFFDVRITGVEPPGAAAVGQVFYGESGPRFLRLRLKFVYTEIDAVHFRLGLDVQLPFGIAVREVLDCVPLGDSQCRVNYHCNFSVPGGWRGAIVRLVMRRKLDAGPIDSILRLKRAAERLYGDSLG